MWWQISCLVICRFSPLLFSVFWEIVWKAMQHGKNPRLQASPLKPCWHAAPYRSESDALYVLIMASIRENVSTEPSYKHISATPPHPFDTHFHTLTARPHLSRHEKTRNGSTFHFIYLFIYVFRGVFFSQSICDSSRKELLHVLVLAWVLLFGLLLWSANKRSVFISRSSCNSFRVKGYVRACVAQVCAIIRNEANILRGIQFVSLWFENRDIAKQILVLFWCLLKGSPD